MKCLVTGATGFIGSSLVRELLSRNNHVAVLVRSENKLPPGIRDKVAVYRGELHDDSVLDAAMKNCDCVFHLAGFAGVWSKDKSYARRINAGGTEKIMDAALRNNIQKVVYTSTAGTLPPSEDGGPVDEDAPVSEAFLTDYESSKRQAELVCRQFAERGLHVVIVNPTRVYGPGMLNKSNSVTILIRNYLRGTWRFIPGSGSQTGNYVFIDDVVRGHVLAMEKGNAGERYILGGDNITFRGFFRVLGDVSGKKRKLFHLPVAAMKMVAEIELFLAEKFNKPPLITPPWVERYNQQRPVSSMKAVTQLGYSVTPLHEGIEKTIAWLESLE